MKYDEFVSNTGIQIDEGHSGYIANIIKSNRGIEESHLIEKDINSILEIDFDWEGSGLEKPLHQSLDFACKFMKSLVDRVFSDEELATQWISPLHIYIYIYEGCA